MMNTFTLHFPIENIQQSQSSLKWSLLWNLWLWIPSLFISRSKMFSRVANLLWNDEYIHSLFPDRKHIGFEYIRSPFPDWKHSPEYPTFRIDLNFFVFELVVVFELFVWPALGFLDQLEFFSSWLIQLTLQSAVFLTHQAFSMHFGTVNWGSDLADFRRFPRTASLKINRSFFSFLQNDGNLAFAKFNFFLLIQAGGRSAVTKWKSGSMIQPKRYITCREPFNGKKDRKAHGLLIF